MGSSQDRGNGNRLLVMAAILALSQAYGLEPTAAHAAGKPKPRPPADPLFEQARPFRAAHLQDVRTLPFTMPNGARLDLAADLYPIMEGATTRASRFRSTQNPIVDECGNHLAVSAALTSLDLNVFGAQIRFGYSPQGEFSSGITDLRGKLRVDVGLIGMDFGVWRCKGSDCAEVIAARKTHNTVNAGLTFEVDFDEITTAADFMYQTPVGETISKIMERGIAEIDASERVHGLPWRAEVREVRTSPDGVFFWLNAGEEQGIGVNQLFTVFAPTQTGSTCDVYKAVGVAHTSSTSVVSSEAKIDQADPARGVQEGDVVMVRRVPPRGSSRSN